MIAKELEKLWSTTSKESVLFCKKAGIDPEVLFAQTALVDGLVFVSGTAGKAEEFKALESACETLAYEGYVFFGGPKETIAKALHNYQLVLLKRELERREDEVFNTGNIKKVEKNVQRVKQDTEKLFQKIQAKKSSYVP
jgi:UDP-N-acetylmuramoylalanine-D-glutamate ligase